MPTHYRSPVYVCDTCAATVDRPATKEEGLELYDKGWRFRPNGKERPLRFAPHTAIVSCPGCPPVATY
jgi:hypothetical protein